MSEAPILAFIAGLPGTKPQLDGSLAFRCPAHGKDRHPSGSASCGDEGRGLVHCFAGCSTEAIMAAWGRPMTDLFVPKAYTNGHPPPSPESKPRVWIAYDTSGQAWTHTRPGPHGAKYGWQRRTPMALLYPYLSDQVEGDTEIWVEGEPAADRLRAMGLPVVGTFGTSYRPFPEALERSRGKICKLWPDADHDPPVGRAHMLDIAGKLDGIAASVLWIEPPAGKPDHWDAADATDSEINQLIEAAGPVPVDGPEEDAPKVWTVSELAELPSAEEEYIVADGILTRGGKLLIYAKSGAGKTTFLDFLAGPLASGTPFLGRYAIDRPHRVVVVQGELSIPEMSSHAQQLVSSGYASDGLLFTRMTDLRLPGGEERLRSLVVEHRADIICLDPWYRLFSGESSDKPEQVGVVFDVCDRLLEDGLVEAVAVVHHANVTGLRTAGSWLFEGWPSTILRIELVAGVPSQRVLTFEKIRAPSSALLGERLTIELADEGYGLVVPSEEPTGAGVILAVAVVREAGGQLHRKELIARLMVRAICKQRAANKYLGQAVQQGLLRKVPDGAEMVYQVVAEAES